MQSNAISREYDKIKLIISDLDGVLLDTRILHKKCLNMALASIDQRYVINDEEHASRYDGLPTTVKLSMLTKEKGLPQNMHSAVWKLKQDMTLKVVEQDFTYDERLRGILRELKIKGYVLCCASNSIWKTISRMLEKKGLLEFFDYVLSNEDVKSAKPSPEIYLTAMNRFKCAPRETLILEDSDIGRTSALLSEGHLCPIVDPDDLTLEKVLGHVAMAEEYNKNHPLNVCGRTRKLNIVVPMAGAGSRYV